MSIRTVVPALALGLVSGAFAQEPEPVVPRPQATSESKAVDGDQDQGPSKKRGLTVLPVVSYAPETHWAFGVAGLLYLGTAEQGRPSALRAIGIVTTRHQIQFLSSSDLYFRSGAYRLLPEIGFTRWPDKFYGIGNDTKDEEEEAYTGRRAYAWIRGLRTVAPRLQAGIAFEIADLVVQKTEPGGQLASGTIPGSQGGSLSGLGTVVTYDSRDRGVSPSAGTYAEAQAVVFAQPLGSDFSFNRYVLDLRKYVSVGRSHVVATQAYLRLTTGTPPFQQLGAFGGQYRMRGFYEGRFRDRDMIELQAEYRLPLFWRLGMVGFLGTGDVAHSPGEFTLHSFKTAFGLGLRVAVQRKRRLNVRMDVAWGSGGNSGVYLFAEEAF